MSKLDELKDGYGGDVLTAENVDVSLLCSLVKLFAMRKDFDVFADDGRYERWIDLYPDVDLRRCDVASGRFVFVAPVRAIFPFGFSCRWRWAGCLNLELLTIPKMIIFRNL